jgi:hypothetical protein
MQTLSRRTVIVGTVVLVVAIGAAVSGALAAAGAFDPAAERQAYLDDAAKRLGVTSTKLEDALKGAAIDRVDAALQAGRITKDEANAMKAAIESGKLPLGGLGFGFGFGFGHRVELKQDVLEDAATYLGLTESQLQTQLESGKSLADVARAKGKSVDGLEQAILKDATSKLDQAVKDGRLTSAQRDQLLADLEVRVHSLVNRTPLSPPLGGLGLGFGLGLKHFGFGFGHHGFLSLSPFSDAAASYLGLTEDELETQLEAGKSLAEIAKAHGKSVAGLEQAIKHDLESKLDQAVKNGLLTSAQRDQLLSDLNSRIHDLVSHAPLRPPMGAFRAWKVPRFVPGGFGSSLPAETPPAALPTA